MGISRYISFSCSKKEVQIRLPMGIAERKKEAGTK